ncbi:MAG TPA: LCP family protein [Candidatus Acidoferrales bacterium]|nr:LCP family protein [Candidatus Acidoferrales bacterium]
MRRARPRARRSRYTIFYRLSRSAVALVVLGVLVTVMLFASVAAVRVYSFVHTVTGQELNPLQIVQQVAEPQPGTIAYKLKHGERVAVLLVGYGGDENDAPYLTDSIMAVVLDPQTHRVLMASIPRDLIVTMDLSVGGGRWVQKINAAFEVAYLPDIICCPAPQYTGRDGGGHAAEHAVGIVTGLTFDRYIGVDFHAFRDMVDALGGIDIHMDTSLHDCHYPNYGNGYLNHGVPEGWPCPNPNYGIRFPAGDYHVNGEQALEIARSRHADEPEQSSDFGRARRQQMIMTAIKKKATTVNGFAKAPQLMAALEKNFKTDMSLSDMKAVYDWGQNLPDSQIVHAGVSNDNFLQYCRRNNISGLCPQDESWGMLHRFFSGAFVDPKALGERAPIQLVNGSSVANDVDDRNTNILDMLGFQVADPAPHPSSNSTYVLDFTNGAYPQTAQWLAGYFGAQVQLADPSAPAPRGQQTYGLVVLIGRDFAGRWHGSG